MASYDEAYSFSMRDEAVVGMSLVQILSLTDIVQP